MGYENRIWCGTIGAKYVNQKVELFGWVNRVRDMGGILFVDLRDRSGIIQLVVDQKKVSNFDDLAGLSNEDVIRVVGVVRQRPRDKINTRLPTGEYEVDVERIDILSKSDPLPFAINEEDYKEISTDESLRLRYRFLDLRRPRMFRNLYFRHKFIKKIRDFLDENGFIEVETPILSKPTPEGARDFLVPSRLQPGKFYALPQSPQLYKQILMVSGIDRYFQIAKCLRDEDLRADRQPEFTQLDLEMSFIDQEDIFNLIENLLKEVLLSTMGIELQTPFPRISYKIAMEEYLSDKPDLRFPYPIKRFDTQKVPINNENLRGEVYYLFIPFILNRKEIDNLYNKGYKFLYLIREGENYKGTLLKYIQVEKMNELVENREVYTVLLTFDQPRDKLDEIKRILIDRKVLLPACSFYFLWVKDFPLFKLEEDGKISSEHHPFTNVHPEDKDYLYELYNEFRLSVNFSDIVPKLLNIKSLAYDLVLNGVEVGSGSIRITDPELQKMIFHIIGLTDEEANSKFGFLLNSFRYGVPPHGGIALGLDRIISILLMTNSIRDVIAFPKTQSGSCLLTNSPSEVDRNQLLELGINTVPLAQ
ncbi:MAG: aspartate--tRNA ligase [Candidatus Calescibacterium sp.]|nr:aspartate--tRNA ligase [Candidatus Calescibacterium sp.]MCX7972518.1 aspartate--tRNA ligase [bacterium]MDW8195589.1 aspartate--tRNA ligase [Candidatus Calescibacterium sp.]